MKRKWISFLVVFITFGCFFLTMFTKNPMIIYILFGSLFILAIAMIPLYLKRIKKEYQRQETKSNDEIIDEINASTGDNSLEQSVQEIRMVTDTWKNSDRADKIKGTLFLLFFLGCIIGFVICMFIGQMIAGFICFGLGMAEILIALIVVKLKEHFSLHFHSKGSYRQATATVLGTSLSSQSTTGKRHKSILHTTYKVHLRIENENRIAYSKEYYETGDKVMVQMDMKHPKRVHILYTKEDPFDFDEDRY